MMTIVFQVQQIVEEVNARGAKTEEKKGGFFGIDSLRNKIEEIIQQQDLLDFKPKKWRYTWTKYPHANST